MIDGFRRMDAMELEGERSHHGEHSGGCIYHCWKGVMKMALNRKAESDSEMLCGSKLTLLIWKYPYLLVCIQYDRNWY